MSEQNKLSDREIQILELVAEGLTNREIAQTLMISPNTVKAHLSNIFEKLAVASRTEATVYAIEHGIVDVPGVEEAAGHPQRLIWNQLRKYIWVLIPMILLVLLFLVTLLSNVLMPSPQSDLPGIDESSERWQERVPMPEYRSKLAAAAYNGEIYAIAGETLQGVSASVLRYSPEENIWTPLEDKPTPVSDIQAAMIGEKIYVPGGTLSDGSPTDILEIYDPRRDQWERGTALPKPLSSYALTDFEGLLYLFGGWDGEKAIPDVLIYDPASDSWRKGTPMTHPRYDAGAVSLIDKIILLGGRDEDTIFQSGEVYYPTRDVNDEKAWEAFVDLPSPRADFGVASIYDAVYVIGGETGDAHMSGGSGYILTNGAWLELPINQEYVNSESILIPLGNILVLLNPSHQDQTTEVWTYEAFYYSIYIPVVPQD